MKQQLLATGLFCFTIGWISPLTAVSYYGFTEARQLYEQGASAEAATIFNQLAQDGDIRAQYYLGLLASRGELDNATMSDACDWYEQAANNDHLPAMYELGNCYLHGNGRRQDIDQALYLYGMAAEHGQIDAQHQLAQLYATDGVVPKNPERAYIYLFLALRGDLSQAPRLKESLEAELSDWQQQRAQAFALKLLQRQKYNSTNPVAR